ncbi:MAG: isoleucine--tRNA ligase, partial [Acholeplasmatales bacterium]|nr:isoleucine--tRNA ligase [Acholeplasmatales bacterium]
MDYKDTLLMPATSFPMRAQLATKELEIKKYWDSINLYKKVLLKNKNNTPFVLHDGPPYANGSIHIGHAFQKTLKDFVLRYKTLNGYYVRYIPGWDTHGLPIEHEVSKKYNRKTLSKPEFRSLCHDFALSQVDKQRENFKRLGILGEWDKPYLTLDKDFECSQIKTFGQMVEKKLIYRGQKPIYWSPSSESALAEAEIEYQDIDTKSIYVAFKITDTLGNELLEDANILIWTTTPWTLVSNVAISVNPKFKYAVISYNSKKYVVLESLLDTLVKKNIFSEYTKEGVIEGVKLEYVTYKHPLFDKTGYIILGEHVLDTDGTGAVHTAPGHGEDDYIVGLKYKLPIFSPVNQSGIFTEEAFQYASLYYEKANDIIINDLKELGALMGTEVIRHSYPHDWRTKKPIIFRATPQWFCSIELLKEDLLKNNNSVNWIPSWGLVRMENMIKGRKDWCISRQRVWGVPLPIFYASNGVPILDKKVINHVASLFKKYGSDIWFTKEASELLPEGYKNINSPDGVFTKETDIMDVWFDSGTSYNVLKTRHLNFPADLYLEGSDQYRGWFNSSLITSTAVNNISPYKSVVTHGFVLDGKGYKMSKSAGNVIDPSQVINTYGADVLRLWASTTDYQSDVRISEDGLKQVSEIYR